MKLSSKKLSPKTSYFWLSFSFCLAVSLIVFFTAQIDAPTLSAFPTSVEQKKTQATAKTIPDLLDTIFIADTENLRELGLAGRSSITAREGMLFVFSESKKYPFWMKGMQFPLDIVWLDKNFNVVDKKSDLTPESYPQQFVPKTSARYVLETNAGFFAENNLKIGDSLIFLKKFLP